MTEKLLQYIWQFQYYNQQQLTTVDGQELSVLHPGIINHNQGPDFSDAKIKVGNTTWAGNIEVHVKSSNWKLHQHQEDSNYKNIILHVVWQDDITLNLPFPVLELQSRISAILHRKYDELMNKEGFIPCEKSIHQIPAIIWDKWKERLLVERLQNKSGAVLQLLQQNNFHWEEVFWWMLAKNFGIKVNSDAFEKIAQSLPLSVLAKHKNQLHQTEALLFGQAGLLQGNFKDSYPEMLKKEFAFLQKKYKLQPIIYPLHFLRMRPSNFPSVRLAQLAMLIHNSHHLFSKIRESSSVKDLRALLDVMANDYWHHHYVFDDESVFKKKQLGLQMVNNIIINTIIPLLFAYGHYHKLEEVKEKVMQLQGQVNAEKNNITTGFAALGIQNNNAFDSQALLQLKNEYCNKKRCLECAVGNKLLKNL